MVLGTATLAGGISQADGALARLQKLLVCQDPLLQEACCSLWGQLRRRGVLWRLGWAASSLWAAGLAGTCLKAGQSSEAAKAR